MSNTSTKKYILIGIIIVAIIGSGYFILKTSQQPEIKDNVDDGRICITEPGKAYYPPNEKCCNGLKSIFGSDVPPAECKLLKETGVGAPVCAPCGNGICETQYEENKCSCSEDCK